MCYFWSIYLGKGEVTCDFFVIDIAYRKFPTKGTVIILNCSKLKGMGTLAVYLVK